MPRRRGKVKDKWREKVWVTVQAPSSFGSAPIAYLPITDTEKAIGRIVETTLFDIVKQDPQQYAIKLYFQIDRIEDSIAYSSLKGHEYSREYLRSLIRRGSSMVNLIGDYTTKDGVTLRVYVVVFTQGRVNSSRKHGIRVVAHNVLIEKTKNLTYDQFSQEAVLGKIASDIYNQAKKISHLRHVGVRKMKVIKRIVHPEMAIAEEEPKAVEAPA